MKVREILRMLKGDGWIMERTPGRHCQFRHPIKPGTAIFSGRPAVDVPSETLIEGNAINNQRYTPEFQDEAVRQVKEDPAN